MSRLESSAEPSMEEILASIRKIIAEEPAAGRSPPPQPRSQSAATASAMPQRGFMSREAFIRSTHEPDPEPMETVFDAPKLEPRVDPKLRVDPKPVNGSASVRASSPERIEDILNGKAAPMGADKPAAKDLPAASGAVSKKPAEAPAKADAAKIKDSEPKIEAKASPRPDIESIDAQLSGLLADDLHALATTEGIAVDGRSSESKPKSDSLENVIAETVAAELGSKPEKADAAKPSASPDDMPKVVATGVDPFAFDLGPSPFAAKPAAVPAAEGKTTKPAVDLPKKDAPNQATAAAAQPTPVAAPPASTAEPASSPKAPSVNAVKPAPASPSTAAYVSPLRPADIIGAPSVAATLGPNRNLEPLSASFQIGPLDVEPRVAKLEAKPTYLGNSALMSQATANGARERVDGFLQDSGDGNSDMDRALEDTVADLLRPMLKSWLAENMPKIVERALRREISERLLPNQKKTFD